jgi:LysR family glycine cleavage system transcriptional activator
MSFSLAASELNVTQGAISRQVKNLEDFLGVELFLRLPRHLELTEQGARLAASLHEGFEQLYRAADAIIETQRPVTLSINVLPTFAMKWLIPRLLKFTAANPNIEVRMTTSIGPVDFRVEGNDLAIRVAPYSKSQAHENSPIDLVMTQNWSDVRSLPFLPDNLIAVTSPRLLAEGPPIERPIDLLQYRMLTIATRDRAWSYWLKTIGLDPETFVDYIAYGHYFMAIQAAIEGKGVALVPEILIDNELKSGALVNIFTDHNVTSGAYYFLCRESHWDNPKIERFRNWLVAESLIGREGKPNFP